MAKNERIEENNFRMRCDSRILLTKRKHAWHKAGGVRIGPFGVKVTLASFLPFTKTICEGSSCTLRKTLLLASCLLAPLALGQDATPPAVPPNTGGVVANGLQSVIN